MTKITSYFLSKQKEYGSSVAIWSTLYLVFNKIGILETWISNKKHQVIKKYLQKKYSHIVSKYQSKRFSLNQEISITDPIWICWWDGEEKMPDIVKICYKSVCKNAEKHPVFLITKFNYQNYVSIPDYITEKTNNGIISITHFSDILRMSLLYEYGGIWMDATIFMTNSFRNIFSKDFFTIKTETDKIYVSQCRWTSFFIGGTKNNILFEFMRTMFFEYWKTENVLIEYLLIDYLIAIAYDLIPSVHLMIDQVPQNNSQLYIIQNNLNNTFNYELFNQICTDTYLHKLTWKKELIESTNFEKFTFFGYLKKMYDVFK